MSLWTTILDILGSSTPMRVTVDAKGRRPAGVLRHDETRRQPALRANMMLKPPLFKAEELIEALENDNAQRMLLVASDT